MRNVCALCGYLITIIRNDPGESHGLCYTCFKALMAEAGEPDQSVWNLWDDYGGEA